MLPPGRGFILLIRTSLARYGLSVQRCKETRIAGKGSGRPLCQLGPAMNSRIVVAAIPRHGRMQTGRRMSAPAGSPTIAVVRRYCEANGWRMDVWVVCAGSCEVGAVV